MTRIIALSDIHLSPTHGFFWRNWCIARDFAKMLNPEAVILNGDLCVNGPDSDAEMAFAGSALRELGDNVLALPGNHDVGDGPPGQHEEQIVNRERLARWSAVFGRDRWTFDAGDWRLVGANAQLFGSGLPQETDQHDWLAQRFAAAKDKPIALFLHKPLFFDAPGEDIVSPGCTPPAARKAVLELIRASGVRLVVSGHLHQYREMTADGVRYLWLPATAFAAPTLAGGDPRCGLAVLEFGADTVDVQIEYPLGLVSHDLHAIKEHGRYPFLRDMPPCPPQLSEV